METDTNKSIALELRDVSLSFDDKQVLNRVSLQLGRGEMLFITGASGSGKSTLLFLLMGLLQPDSGQILVEGVDFGKLDETELLKIRGERMGMVFQEDSLFTGMTVYDNAAYRLVEHGLSEQATETAVAEVLKFVGLDRDADKLPAELSGGMRRRLEIARALIGWPSIMLFDEPASGLDPLTSVQVLDLIIRARDVYGISSVYVTKKLDEITYLATHRAKAAANNIVVEEVKSRTMPRTRALVLDNGSIVFNGSLAEFDASELPAVTHLTKADNGTVFSHVNFPDPWDKRRQPAEKIL